MYALLPYDCPAEERKAAKSESLIASEEVFLLASGSPPNASFFKSELNPKVLIAASSKTLHGSFSTFFHLSNESSSAYSVPLLVLIIE
jgi:hypothetical protein